MRRWLEGIGVPSSKILRIEGKDAAMYPDRASIIDAGMTDGFPELIELSEMPQWYGKGDAAYAWAIRCVLRQVASEDGACVVLLDDAELLKQFYEYETLVAEAGNFDIIQLAPWCPSETSTEFYELLSKMPEPTTCRFDIRFQHGCPYPGEHASIYSPEGARKMLDALSRPGNVKFFPEGINENDEFRIQQQARNQITDLQSSISDELPDATRSQVNQLVDGMVNSDPVKIINAIRDAMKVEEEKQTNARRANSGALKVQGGGSGKGEEAAAPRNMNEAILNASRLFS